MVLFYFREGSTLTCGIMWYGMIERVIGTIGSYILYIYIYIYLDVKLIVILNIYFLNMSYTSILSIPVGCLIVQSEEVKSNR